MMGLRPSKLQIYMKATRCGHRCLRCDSSSKASFVVILTPILDKEDHNASRFKSLALLVEPKKSRVS